MPRRDDLHKILILGSGPIVIGQAAEFDYSGVQACKVLKEEGYEIVLVNSNPATIMTDPEFADVTYIEPLLPGPLAQIIERERPDALLPTLGGQTALNLAKALHEDGTLRALRGRADRRRLRRHLPRRGPRPLPPDDGRGRAEDAAQRDRHVARRRARRPPRARPAVHRAPGLHPRRPRRRDRAHRGGVRAHRRARPGGVAHRPGPARPVGPGLGRVRASRSCATSTTTS